MQRLFSQSLSSVSAAHAKLAMALCCALIMLAIAPATTKAADDFTEDAAAAMKKAVAEGKDVLLLFTGSDWCPPCKRLEAEVFSKEAFLDGASKDFVLIKFDYPKQAAQDETVKEQNTEWAANFGIESYPTVIITDNELKPIRFAGYEEGGPENYLNILSEAKELRVNRDAKLKAADAAKGDEKAKLLDEALTEIGEEIVGVYYTDLVEKIVAIDNDNRLGLRAKWNGAADTEMRKIVITDLLMMARIGKPVDAIALIDEVLTEIAFTNTEKLTILQMKLNLAKALKDSKKIDAVLDQMISLDGVEGVTKHRLIAKKAYLMVGSGRRAEALKLLDDQINQAPKASHLFLAKGQLLAAKNENKTALEAFESGLESAGRNADLKIDLVAAKADTLYASEQADEALKVLDDYADDDDMPSELRAEALLHKGMIMREMGRDRQARLTENRAIEVTESPKERAAIQMIVDRLRSKSDSE